MTKLCSTCKQTLPVDSFHRSKRTSDGLSYKCKACDKHSRQKYREDNRERFRMVARRKQLKWNYGLTLEDYERLLEEQEHKCAICFIHKSENTGPHGSQNLVVDHDHYTGKVRGLLCNNCNRAIGLLNDSWQDAHSAYLYLSRLTKE